MAEDMKPKYCPESVKDFFVAVGRDLPHADWLRIGKMIELRCQGQTRVEVRQWLKDKLPDEPPPPPPGQPISLGDWKGFFLVGQPDADSDEHNLYFAPSCVSWPAPRRRRLFEWMAAHGMTHVHLNAEQRNWGPSKGNWKYTEGAPFSVHTDGGASLRRYQEVVAEGRSYGFTVTAGVFEQSTIVDRPMSTLIAQAQRLVDATFTDVALYQWSWEYTYVLPVSVTRRAHEDRFLREVDWRGRHIGLHYQPALETLPDGTTLENYPHDLGLSGGIARYQQMTAIYPHVCRLMQWSRGANEATVRLQTQAAMVVHGHGPGQHKLGSFCCFELSGGMRLSPSHSPAQVLERRGWVMDEIRKANMPADRSGYLG